MTAHFSTLCVIQRKEQLLLRKTSGDAPQSTKHSADHSDVAASNSSSVPRSAAIADDIMFTQQQLINANGRTLIHRCGLANGMSTQSQ